MRRPTLLVEVRGASQLCVLLPETHGGSSAVFFRSASARCTAVLGDLLCLEGWPVSSFLGGAGLATCGNLLRTSLSSGGMSVGTSARNFGAGVLCCVFAVSPGAPTLCLPPVIRLTLDTVSQVAEGRLLDGIFQEKRQVCCARRRGAAHLLAPIFIDALLGRFWSCYPGHSLAAGNLRSNMLA